MAETLTTIVLPPHLRPIVEKAKDVLKRSTDSQAIEIKGLKSISDARTLTRYFENEGYAATPERMGRGYEVDVHKILGVNQVRRTA